MGEIFGWKSVIFTKNYLFLEERSLKKKNLFSQLFFL